MNILKILAVIFVLKTNLIEFATSSNFRDNQSDEFYVQKYKKRKI